jgi:hypothetical protein
MHLLSSARVRRSIVGLSATFALLIAPGISTTFAAEQPTVVSPFDLSHEPGLRTQPTNGIIMRDGGVCDPIRHMGC